ncbi:hypothetical protein LOK49_LG04G00227 [Camellia lanceoleosa]|uniref:Uncharacterized protein n=1 Tax=Camellia lanceoleosa TaxID=1840588 RepID=A0ACC0I0I7_9ERIC|nr:hypothetical protein LOK49_LG04G00227 [Camellia lanceoleosa]
MIETTVVAVSDAKIAGGGKERKYVVDLNVIGIDFVFVELVNVCRCVGRNEKRSASASWSQQAYQTSTRNAPKRQSRLPYKKQRVSVSVAKKAAVDTSKPMYRSNISNVINTVLELEFGDGHIWEIRKTPFAVHYDKLVGTIRECHIVKHEPVLIDHTEGSQNVIDVDLVTDRRNVDPSFNCWQTDSAESGHVRTEGIDVNEKHNNGTPSSKEKVIDAYGAMLTDMHRTKSVKENIKERRMCTIACART